MSNRDRRRISWRNYQRRKRAAALARACVGRTTCPRKFGRFECGGQLETIVLRNGSATVRCVRCERLKAGICLECPRRVDGAIGWARRCAYHHQLAMRDQTRKWRREHREDAQAAQHRYYHDHRDERNAASRDWKRAHPERVKRARIRWRQRRAAELARRAA